MVKRRQAFAWTGAALLLAAAGPRAQMHHVEKAEKVTRAVGVYEWTGELSKPSASRFVPVSLFINGHFEDAGLYLSRPVPFALESGDLYTVERSGEPAGQLALESAARVVSGNALADDNPTGAWYGFGTFTGEAAPKAAPALHKSAHVGVIQTTSTAGKAAAADGGKDAADDDGRPHMNRRNPDASAGSDTGGSSSGSGSGNSRSTSASTDDDTDRPTLARRNPAEDSARRKAAVGGKKGTSSVTAAGPQPGDDPDRPTLSHRSSGEAEGPKPLTGLPADLHQAVAVSDPVSREPHPFARAWEDPAERTQTLAALEALAKPRVAAYLADNHLVPSSATLVPEAAPSSTEGIAANTENGAGAPPKLQRGRPREYGGTAASASPAPKAAPARPRPGTRTAHTAAAKPSTAPAALKLQDAAVSGFTLSYGGLPTFVYTASAATERKDAGDLPPGAARPTAFITVVAQRLPSGELQVALSAVTDSAHLDRGPRLRLIDAVDPDASHRASLLFELRGSNSRQFAFYRLTSARAENTFTSASIE